MHSVQDIARDIVVREGGFVNDPDDPGGPTKYGVTLRTLRALGRDVNADGDIDIVDVRSLSVDDAVGIFAEHYFAKPKISDLPAPLHATVFDMYVNAGAAAVRLLQTLLNDMLISVSVDGVIGPQTVAACERALEVAPNHFVDAYGIARRNYYYRLAGARPASRKFATTKAGTKGGWIKRAEEFIAPKYHLTEAEHRQRVSAWA